MLVRLTDGVNDVDFDPGYGYDVPGRKRRVIDEALDGTIYQYDFADKKRYDVPVNNMPKADADRVNTWWDNTTKITYYPDYESHPALHLDVYILSEERPLQMAAPFWDDRYNGSLVLADAS